MDLVPRLVRIVHDADRSLDLQVLLISHHDVAAFSSYADRMYRIEPAAFGVVAKAWATKPAEEDRELGPG